jgi:AraC-like DNA-binding protein
MTIIQHTVQPTSVQDVDEQEHIWRTLVRDRLAAIDLRRTGGVQRCPTAEYRDLGDLQITDWDCPGLEGIRSSRMAAREPEALVLLTAFAGRQIVDTPQRTEVLRPGDVLIMSTHASAKIVVPEAVRKRTVRIPLAALAPFDTGPGVPDCLLLDAEQNPLASLAHGYLAGVGPQIDQMSPVEVEGARNALLVLTAGMIRATRATDVGETDFLPLLRRQLEEWIIDHLSLGAIRVRDLAAAHNVASRTVHRAFAATGDTVGSVVRAHRIAAARSDLVNTTSSIATIAHRWGFCDASHLGREFRRTFSMSPGDYRDAYSAV